MQGDKGQADYEGPSTSDKCFVCVFNQGSITPNLFLLLLDVGIQGWSSGKKDQAQKFGNYLQMLTKTIRPDEIAHAEYEGGR